jgi:hypothetical protein
MRKQQWVAPKGKDAKKEPATKPKIAGDGETAERMRQASKGKKTSKPQR